MIETQTLSQPAVLLTLAAIMGLAVALTIAVVRTVQAPAKRQSFSDALGFVMSSELDIDTALNQTEKTSEGWFGFWLRVTRESGRVVRDTSAPGRTAIGVLVGGIVVGYATVPGGVLGAVIDGAVFLFVLYTVLTGDARKRTLAMEKQLPQLLSSLRANLQAGSTPQQAMLAVADDLPSPLGDEMRNLKQALNVNVALEVAMADLAKAVPSREMKFLVASVEIAVSSGADLDPQLETIEEIVKQRTRIRSKLRAAVAQVKPTKYLAYGAVPGMWLFMSRTPENRSYWFGHGFYMLVIAGILYGLGMFAIRTMVKGVEGA